MNPKSSTSGWTPIAAVAAAFCALLCLPPAPAAAATFDCYQGCSSSLVSETDCLENDDPDLGDWHTSCTGLAACPDAGSDVTVLSIHGGRIERWTSDVSAELAGLYGWNLYDFNAHLISDGDCRDLAVDGSSSNDNYEVLHVTATGFDHAEALTLVGAHPDAVSIHGCGQSCSDSTICVGGRNTQQVTDFNAYFSRYAGLLPNAVEAATVPSTTPFCGSNLAGTATQNIVNRTSTGQGLQLEMSLDVRADLASGAIGEDLLRGVVYGAVASAMGELPPPLATLEGVETYSVGTDTYERFLLDVENFSEYPQELFDPAPNLPPCGLNTNSSRTWAHIRDADDDGYVYGFCSLGTPASLDNIWFSRLQGTAPDAVYVVLEDRETGREYRSNRVSTMP